MTTESIPAVAVANTRRAVSKDIALTTMTPAFASAPGSGRRILTCAATLLFGMLAAPAATAAVCDAFVFPYTLSGSDNAARVVELRQAIECANASLLDSEINLGGYTVTFSDGPYADGHGATALPIVNSPVTLTLRNGGLERDPQAVTFRLLQATTPLVTDGVDFRHGDASDRGGAILAAAALTAVRGSFEDNHAAVMGGAIASIAATDAPMLVGSVFSGNRSPVGAVAASDAGLAVLNSRILDNGDTSTTSLLDGALGVALVNSLVVGNVLDAAGSTLLTAGIDSTQTLVASSTLVDNAVQGSLLTVLSAQPGGLNSSIVWGNSYASLGTTNVSYSIVQEALSGNGNLNVDPAFVDAANGDYQLDSGSPAIDAASGGYPLPDLFDLDGDGITSAELGPDLANLPRLVDDANAVDTGVSQNGQPVQDMGAFERQHDSAPPAITVTPIDGLTTTEAGGVANFSVAVTSAPTADVVIQLSSSNPAEGAAAPAQLTFTSQNWRQAQTVSVTGADDAVADGDVGYFIVTAPATSADTRYGSINPADVAVTNVDDETAEWQVGGTVTGLLGSGLTLSLNAGAQTLVVAADGSFVFSDALPSGSSYAVSIANQPGNPAQSCVVVNANGSVASQDIDTVVVNCGPANTYAVGGTLSGLAAGAAVVLKINGGNALNVAANGAWVFPLHFAPGSAYVVSIAAQPVGQHCSLGNPNGTVGTANVSSVSVDCAAGGPALSLSIDDGGDYARYGSVRDYQISLSNTGNGTADAVQVSSSLDSAFDAANAHWICINGTPGATCAAQGAGALTDTVTLPPGATLVWILSAPVRVDSQAESAVVTIHVDTTPDASDLNTLVLFRDGYDVPYGERSSAVAAVPAAARSSAATESFFTLIAPAGEGITPLLAMTVDGRRVQVEGLRLGQAIGVRLKASDATGQQHVGNWMHASEGALLGVGSVRDAGTGQVILLEGANSGVSLRLDP